MSRLSQNKSLISRISILSFLGISIAILVAGSFIIWSFNRSIEKSLSNNISAYIDIFISATSLDNKGNVVISDETDILNNIPRYWQISSETAHLKKSPLLKQWVEVKPNKNPEKMNFVDADGTQIIAMQQTVTFPGNKQVIYLFGLQSEIADAFRQEQEAGFLLMLFGTLVMLTIMLMFFTYLQVKFTIGPLTKIKESLRLIKSGDESRLRDNFPKEIQPLADEINNLLAYGMEVVERHRSFASNLSHALKTPLSVLNNEAQKTRGKLADIVKDKASIMLAIIDRNLTRAKIAGSNNILGAKVEVLPILTKISGSFAKFYQKEVEINCEKGLFFRGDEGDLFEMLGNIIENACKYSTSKIRIAAEVNQNLTIIVEDDGKGIPENERKKVLERGVRLDEAIPGNGIGLPIAKDIIELYNGSIVLGDSDLGGLKVIIMLPSAEFIVSS